MTDFSLAANMYGMFPNLYNNQIALNDLTGMDMYYPTGLSCDPMLSMNGSIFGGTTMYPYMGSPYAGSYSNPQDYYQNYEKYQNFMVDSSVRQQQRMRNADLRLNSPQEGIAKQAAYLHEKIIRNEQQQIQQSYANFKESVRSMYGDATEQEIANRASTLYTQINGTSLVDDIRQNGRGSFTQGFLQTLTLGFADSKTAEENVAEITGQPVGRSERNKKIAGNALGGAVIGGAGAIGLNLLWKGKKPLTKFLFKIPVLAAIGGLAAGVMAFTKN